MAAVASAQVGGVGRQIVRDRVLRFNAEDPDGLLQRSGSGRPARLNEARLAALIARVETGPLPAIDGALATSGSGAVVMGGLSPQHQRKLPECHLAQTRIQDIDGRVIMARTGMRLMHLKKLPRRNSLPASQNWSDCPAGHPVARMRRVLARRTPCWAKRGTRPVAEKDQRTKSAWIFGAICPARGVGAALVLPQCNTCGMQGHPEEISSQVEPGAHALIILDQAGWHTTTNLDIPDNITLLPPRSPAPVENVWQYLRQNRLSNRVFDNHDQIVSLCCDAWNNLTERPWKIMSIGHRSRAHGF